MALSFPFVKKDAMWRLLRTAQQQPPKQQQRQQQQQRRQRHLVASIAAVASTGIAACHSRGGTITNNKLATTAAATTTYRGGGRYHHRYTLCDSPPSSPSSNKPPREAPDVVFRKRRLTTFPPPPLGSNDNNNDPTTQSVPQISTTLPEGVEIMIATELDDDDDESHSSQPPKLANDTNQTVDGTDSLQSRDIAAAFTCHGTVPRHLPLRMSPGLLPPFSIFWDNIFHSPQQQQQQDDVENNTTDRTRQQQQQQQQIKKTNQDRGHILYYSCDGDDGDKNCNNSSNKVALFGVYDGHGERGELVADFVRREVQHELFLSFLHFAHRVDIGHSSSDRNDLERAIHDIFLEMDDRVRQCDNMMPFTSGSTACVVLLSNDTLLVSNIGDSRAVLASTTKQQQPPTTTTIGTKRITSMDLTTDQNPKCAEERTRIVRSGGYVTMPKLSGHPARVWFDKKCTTFGLAMSRSIGDFTLKQVGIIADPVFTHHVLTERDEFLIVATDGIWEFIHSEEAVTIVQECFERGLGARDACRTLIRTAMARWNEEEGEYRDDITALVIRIHAMSPNNSI